MKKIIIIIFSVFNFTVAKAQMNFTTDITILYKNSDSIVAECNSFFNWGWGGKVDWLRGTNSHVQNDTLYFDLYYSLLGLATGNYYAFSIDTVSVFPIDVNMKYITFRSNWYWYGMNAPPNFDTLWDRNDTTIYLGTLNYLERNRMNTLTLSPNPVQNILTLQSQEPMEQVSIYNMYGVLVQKQTYSEHINVAALRSGVYVLEARGKQGVWRSKFQKE